MDIVYLDQNKWIELARVQAGAVTSGPTADLYSQLLAAVECGKVLFPLSVSHVLETSKRNEPISRGHLAETQAKLSRGYAYRSRAGFLEQADGGTIFMDEVGEMTARMQVVLLRFLETGEIQRVGSDRPHTRVNARVIAATNRNLSNRIGTGDFREDLYYRLNVVHIWIPPLRERRDDIPALLHHFLGVYARQYAVEPPRPSPEAEASLVEYDWPGNVRELRNFVERLTVRKADALVSLADVSLMLGRQRETAGAGSGGRACARQPCRCAVSSDGGRGRVLLARRARAVHVTRHHAR